MLSLKYVHTLPVQLDSASVTSRYVYVLNKNQERWCKQIPLSEFAKLKNVTQVAPTHSPGKL